MKKLFLLFLICFVKTSIAQTWESLRTDTTGFLNFDQYSNSIYKSFNNDHYIKTPSNIVLKFGINNWQPIQSINVSVSESDFIVLPNDTIVFAFVSTITKKITVVKAKNSFIDTVGLEDFSTTNASNINLNRSVNDELVVTYRESNSKLVKAMIFKSNVWQNIGTNNPTPTANNYSFSNKNNKPTIAYKSTVDSKLYVNQFDGTNWVQLGTSISPNYVNDYYDIAQDYDGTIYLIYQNSSNNVSLLKWSGTNWVTLSTLPRTPTITYGLIKLAVSNGIVFIANIYNQFFNVKKFDGTTLTQLGSIDLSLTNNFSKFYIQSFDGNPYIFYPDKTWGEKMTLSTWNNTNWQAIEAKSLRKGITGISTISDVNNNMYTAFRDVESGGKISVMKYYNGKWVYVGTPGFTSTAGDNTTLLFDNNNVLHVLFKASDNKLSAYKFNGVNWIEISQNWNAYDQYKLIYAKFNSNNTLYITCYTNTNNIYVNYGYSYMLSNSNVFSYLPNFWTNNINSLQMTLDATGLPVVVFSDFKSTYKIYVKKFNGSSWIDLNSNNINTDGSNRTSICTDKNGVIHIGYNSWTSQGYIIKKYIGGIWNTVSTNASTYIAEYPQILFNENNELSVFFLENNILKAKKLIGTTWINIGNANFNDILFDRLSIAENKNNYFLAHSYFGGFAYRLLESPEILNPAKIKVTKINQDEILNNSSTINLGSTIIGSAISTKIIVKNLGDKKLIISSISLSNGISVSMSNPLSSLYLEDSIVLTIKATPTIGINSGSITLHSNDDNNNDFNIYFSFTGVKPIIEIYYNSSQLTTNNTPELNLGSTLVNTYVNYYSTITIKNNGDYPLVISSIIASYGFYLQGVPSVPIDAGTSVVFNILSKPTLKGINSGTIIINCNDFEIPIFKINVQSFGTQPILTLTQGYSTINHNITELNLGSSNIYSTVSPSTTFTIQNNGDGMLNIYNITSSNSNFIISNITPSNSINIGTTATFSITAKPILVGENFSLINISSNDANSLFTFKVIANGIDIPKPIMVIMKESSIIYNNAPNIDLGYAYLSSDNNSPLTFSIQNNGNLPLEISSIIASTGYKVSSIEPIVSIDSGANALFTISTTEILSFGYTYGTIEIKSNDLSNPTFKINVRIYGTSTNNFITNDFDFYPHTSLYTFNPVSIGEQSSASQFQFYNNGEASLTLNNPIIDGPFQITNFTPSTIAPYESILFDLKYIPTNIGIESGSITFTSNAKNYPFILNLSGTGTISTNNSIKLTDNALAIYPNPFKKELIFNLNGTYTQSVINIYNIMGVKIYTDIIGEIKNTTYSIVLNDQPSGIYLVEFVTKEGSIVKRIIKE